MRRGTLRLTACTAALCTVLTGCFFRGVDELYAMPEPPEDYRALQAKLSEVLNSGGEYAAPLSGELIQSVQLLDLDGDGQQEAIAFFRFSNEEKPMKIYIFRQNGEAYETMAVVEGAGTAINAIDYVQLNEDPYRELVVSWQMSSNARSLAAYSLAADAVEEILRTDYESYKLSDLDQDNQHELVVLRTPAGEQEAHAVSRSVAELYDYDEVFQLAGKAPLSQNVTAVASGGVRSGYLMDRVPALFAVSGYGDNGTITDVFTYQGGKLRNITLVPADPAGDPSVGESTETIRFYQITGSDINNDGIMELPQPVPLQDYKTTSAAVNFWLIHWRQFDAQGKAHPVFTTYHNDRDGWYFTLPETWGSNLTLTRSDLPGGTERAVTFSYWEGDEAVEPKPFLTIYKLTGANRVRRSTLAGRFILFPAQGLEDSGEANTIYAARFEKGWACGLTEDQVRERFALIKTDWSGGV